ncbi:MAG: hypothetical protein ACI9JN_001579 [Bacteroidia bacterium]|jgi:hypothetical protein
MHTSFGIIFSDDQGSNWKESQDDPRGTVKCGFIEGANDTLFFWASSAGLFYSLDTGATWVDYSGDLTSNDKLFMQDVAFFEGHFYVATVSAVKSNAPTSTMAVPAHLFKENQVRIYPNPVLNEFHITWRDDYKNCKIIVQDISGKHVFQQNVFGNKLSVNISDVMPGLYFVLIKDQLTGTVIHHSKILKE